MTDRIADGMLFFSNSLTLVLISLFGFFFIHRLIFFQVLCLGLFDIVVNVALKGSFQIPLQAPLIGYAFPSGHMQLATVFYVWLAWHSSRYVQGLVMILLFGISASLMHYRYHTVYDVLGGIAFGLGLLRMYGYLVFAYPKKWICLLFGFASVLMVYIGLIYVVIPLHAGIAYGVLFLMAVSFLYVPRSLPFC